MNLGTEGSYNFTLLGAYLGSRLAGPSWGHILREEWARYASSVSSILGIAGPCRQTPTYRSTARKHDIQPRTRSLPSKFAALAYTFILLAYRTGVSSTW